jgi:hypothetical protein
MHAKCCLVNLQDRDHLENLGIDKRIILMLIIEKYVMEV